MGAAGRRGGYRACAGVFFPRAYSISFQSRQAVSYTHLDSGRGVQDVLEVFFIAKEGGFFTGCVKKGSDPEYSQFGVAGKDFSPGEGDHGFKLSLIHIYAND